MQTELLKVNNIRKYFISKGGFLSGEKRVVKAVDGVSFTLQEGEIFGIVGESGCGKSTLGRTILGLIPATEGSVVFDGVVLSSLTKEEMRLKRKDIQVIFQDPGASLNPRMTVGDLIREPLDVFENGMSSEEKETYIFELMDLVGINRSYISRFPHEFSGGQRQRIGIARALASRPRLVICDEPVSALDVSVRAQILNLMDELKEKLNLTYIFISHDLSVVNHICNRVGVMYLGRMVELADTDTLYRNPMHPYTQALLSAIPLPDPERKRNRIILQGDVPNPASPPSGCHFHLRCPYATEQCSREVPELRQLEEGHQVACHRCEEILKDRRGD